MLKKMVRDLAFRKGYLIVPIPSGYDKETGYALHSYQTQDGKFDYESYRKIQETGNKKKINKVWVQEENIKFLADYVAKKIEKPRFGICHGTRRGMEQKWFSEALGCEVIGTEISETATQFPNTIQWDFHNVKDEWKGSVDFIYSNSFDHSYDPEKCLNAWMSCIRPGGLCIIEHSSGHGLEGATELDPFGAELHMMPYLIVQWSKGKFGVREMLPAAKKPDHLSYLSFLVIEHFPA
jgi:hypothetical protein